MGPCKLPSSKTPHLQDEAKYTTCPVKMSFICMTMKNHFHVKGWALNLVLIQRTGEMAYKAVYPGSLPLGEFQGRDICAGTYLVDLSPLQTPYHFVKIISLSFTCDRSLLKIQYHVDIKMLKSTMFISAASVWQICQRSRFFKIFFTVFWEIFWNEMLLVGWKGKFRGECSCLFEPR